MSFDLDLVGKRDEDAAENNADPEREGDDCDQLPRAWRCRLRDHFAPDGVVKDNRRQQK